MIPVAGSRCHRNASRAFPPAGGQPAAWCVLKKICRARVRSRPRGDYHLPRHVHVSSMSGLGSACVPHSAAADRHARGYRHHRCPSALDSEAQQAPAPLLRAPAVSCFPGITCTAQGVRSCGFRLRPTPGRRVPYEACALGRWRRVAAASAPDWRSWMTASSCRRSPRRSRAPRFIGAHTGRESPESQDGRVGRERTDERRRDRRQCVPRHSRRRTSSGKTDTGYNHSVTLTTDDGQNVIVSPIKLKKGKATVSVVLDMADSLQAHRQRGFGHGNQQLVHGQAGGCSLVPAERSQPRDRRRRVQPLRDRL